MKTMTLSQGVMGGGFIRNGGGRDTATADEANRFRGRFARVRSAEAVRTSGSVAEHILTVREATDTADLDAVYRLTHDAFLEQGYCEPQPDGRLIHYPHLEGLPETTALVAEENGEIVGTNSVTLDGPAGLHVDVDFKTECDRIRAECSALGRSLGASWRIATKRSCRSATAVIKGLIRETVRRFVAGSVETVVFTFNPRHERIYKRLLNMTTIARHGGTVQGLNNAPAVFMRWDLETCPDQWLRTRDEFARREAARARNQVEWERRS